MSRDHVCSVVGVFDNLANNLSFIGSRLQSELCNLTGDSTFYDYPLSSFKFEDSLRFILKSFCKDFSLDFKERFVLRSGAIARNSYFYSYGLGGHQRSIRKIPHFGVFFAWLDYYVSCLLSMCYYLNGCLKQGFKLTDCVGPQQISFYSGIIDDIEDYISDYYHFELVLDYCNIYNILPVFYKYCMTYFYKTITGVEYPFSHFSYEFNKLIDLCNSIYKGRVRYEYGAEAQNRIVLEYFDSWEDYFVFLEKPIDSFKWPHDVNFYLDSLFFDKENCLCVEVSDHFIRHVSIYDIICHIGSHCFYLDPGLIWSKCALDGSLLRYIAVSPFIELPDENGVLRRTDISIEDSFISFENKYRFEPKDYD